MKKEIEEDLKNGIITEDEVGAMWSCYWNGDFTSYTDEELDRYSAEVSNGEGYYDTNGRFHWYSIQ